MVTAVTSFGRSGLYDWLMQRFTAIVLGVYTVFIVTFFILNPGLDYEAWSALNQQTWMRIFSLLVVFSVIIHAWIGLWAVLTDYVTARMMGSSALTLRMIVLGSFFLVAFAFVVWAVQILWGY